MDIKFKGLKINEMIYMFYGCKPLCTSKAQKKNNRKGNNGNLKELPIR